MRAGSNPEGRPVRSHARLHCHTCDAEVSNPHYRDGHWKVYVLQSHFLFYIYFVVPASSASFGPPFPKHLACPALSLDFKEACVCLSSSSWWLRHLVRFAEGAGPRAAGCWPRPFQGGDRIVLWRRWQQGLSATRSKNFGKTCAATLERRSESASEELPVQPKR